MLKRLEALKNRYVQLSHELSDPSIGNDTRRLQDLSRQQSELSDIVTLFERFEKLKIEREEARKLSIFEKDPELKAMAGEEYVSLDAKILDIEAQLRIGLLPKDINDGKNAFVEIRSGAGGDEAALFGSELLRMYSRWAESAGLKIETMSLSATEIGGLKEAVILVKGHEAYRQFKHEGGVHRVQRVPETESGGRIHTSTVTVAVMPEIEEKEFHLDERELRWDVFRASGAGGQHVNRTESAVRLTHLPTNTVVSMQDERSQIKNRAKAMKILISRLKALEESAKSGAESAERKGQVGTGDRSEKIRTYNYPQNRVTDHRLGWSSYNLDRVMDGELGPFIDRLLELEQSNKLAGLSEA